MDKSASMVKWWIEKEKEKHDYGKYEMESGTKCCDNADKEEKRCKNREKAISSRW